MKFLNIFFAFLVFTSLFSCGSKGSDEEEILENLSLSSVSEFSANNNSQSVSVTANMYWFTTNTNNWITISPINGTNNGTIKISVDANPNETKRTGTITVKGGSISKEITITQAAKEVSSGVLDPNKAPSEA